MKPYQQQNYYELLEVETSATDEEIRAAYARALELYSDESVAMYALVDPSQAKDLRARLLEAMEFLTEPDLRVEYDREQGIVRPPPPAPVPPPAPAGPPVAEPPPPEPDVPSPQLAMTDLLATADSVHSTLPGYQVSYVPHPPPASALVHAVSSREEPPRRAAEPASAPAEEIAKAPEAMAQPAPPARAEEPPVESTAPVTAPSEPAPPAPPATLVEAVAPPPEAAPAAAAEEAAPPVETSPAQAASFGDATGATEAKLPAPAEVPPEVVEPLPAPVAVPPPEPVRPPAPPPVEEAALPVSLVPRPKPPSPAGYSRVPPRLPSRPLPGRREMEQAPELAQESALAAAETQEREKRALVPAARPKPLDIPPDAEFNGELLRRVRESRGLSIPQLSERTRITSRHLENIEADRYDGLPATVYLRGILMSLAKELGLDPLRVSKSYLGLVGNRPAK